MAEFMNYFDKEAFQKSVPQNLTELQGVPCPRIEATYILRT